jgi:hypothetical protein
MAAMAGLAITGCYTQFAVIERQGDKPDPYIETYVDSTGDTVKVVRQKDTVEIERHQVCYWQRDWFGRPVLRCYRTYYDDDWHYYYDYPWWYDDYSSYSHYGCHCPYHTRYNPHCRYCWEYCNMYYYDRSSGSGSDYGGSGGYSSPRSSQPPPASTGSRGGSGQPIPKSGKSKPIITGPRPKPSVSDKSLPKETEKKSDVSPGIQAPVSPAPAPDSIPESRPKQPRRRFGRTR